MRIPERAPVLTSSLIRGNRPRSGTIGGVSPSSPHGSGRDPGPEDGWPRERSTVRRPRRDEPDYGFAAGNTDPYGWAGLRDPVTSTGELGLDGLAATSNGRSSGGGLVEGARSRLRRPHKRRAVAGQQTGLDPGLQ